MLHQNERSKSSQSDEWWTPHDLFWELCHKYNFYPEIDVAATEGNSLCRFFFTKKDNALKRDWIKGKKRKCWNNPPAKEQGKFIVKAYQQYRDLRIKTMQIVPLNVQSSKAFQNNVQKAIERGEKIMVRPIDGRRVFLYKGKKSVTIKRKKKKITSSINGYCVIIYGKSRDYGFRY